MHTVCSQPPLNNERLGFNVRAYRVLGAPSYNYNIIPPPQYAILIIKAPTLVFGPGGSVCRLGLYRVGFKEQGFKQQLPKSPRLGIRLG